MWPKATNVLEEVYYIYILQNLGVRAWDALTMSLIITTIKQQKQQYYIFKIEKKNHNNSKDEVTKCY